MIIIVDPCPMYDYIRQGDKIRQVDGVETWEDCAELCRNEPGCNYFKVLYLYKRYNQMDAHIVGGTQQQNKTIFFKLDTFQYIVINVLVL